MLPVLVCWAICLKFAREAEFRHIYLFGAIPKADHVESYIARNCIPGGTYRNWKSYGDKIGEITENQKLLLADPQTSGGLLIAVDKEAPDFDTFARKNSFVEIGYLAEISGERMIEIE